MEPNLPVLPRIDRLDRLLELLEEKHTKSKRFGSNSSANDDHDDNDDDNNHDNYKENKIGQLSCKTLVSALDDVGHKGTLIDRLTILENRVLQLSLDMEEGSTSRSTSFTTYATKEEIEVTRDTCSIKSNGKHNGRKVHFQWRGWFATRC